MDNKDDLMNELERMRPTGVVPPAGGSPRYNNIMEKAMSEIKTEKQEVNSISRQQPKITRGRLVFVGSVAAAIVGLGGFVALNQINSEPEQNIATETENNKVEDKTGVINESRSVNSGKFKLVNDINPIDFAGSLGESQGVEYYFDRGLQENDKPTVFASVEPGKWDVLDWPLSEKRNIIKLTIHKGVVFESYRSFESEQELTNQSNPINAWQLKKPLDSVEVSDFPTIEGVRVDNSPVRFISTEATLIAHVGVVEDYDVAAIAEKMEVPVDEVSASRTGLKWVNKDKNPNNRHTEWDEVGLTDPYKTFVYASEDAGQSWLKITPPTDYIVPMGGFFFAIGNKKIYRSTDAQEWSELTLPEDIFNIQQGFEFGNNQIAFEASTSNTSDGQAKRGGGESQALLVSSDLGENWNVSYIDSFLDKDHEKFSSRGSLSFNGSENGVAMTTGFDGSPINLLGFSEDGFSWDIGSTEDLGLLPEKNYYVSLPSGPERSIFSASESTDSEPIYIEFVKN